MVEAKNVCDQLYGWRVAILESGRAERGARGGAIAVWRYLIYFPSCVSHSKDFVTSCTYLFLVKCIFINKAQL